MGIYETSNQWSLALDKGSQIFWRGRKRKVSSGDLTARASYETHEFSLRRRADFVKAVVFAICGGFLKGLFNVPLVALLLFALYSGMSKDAWRSNMTWVNLLSLPPKVYVLFVHRGLYDQSRWPWYLTSAMASILAVPLGNWIAA